MCATARRHSLHAQSDGSNQRNLTINLYRTSRFRLLAVFSSHCKEIVNSNFWQIALTIFEAITYNTLFVHFTGELQIHGFEAESMQAFLG